MKCNILPARYVYSILFFYSYFFFNCHGAVSITSIDLRIKFTSAISPVRQPFPCTSSIRLAPPPPPPPAFPLRPFNFRAPCPSPPLLNPSALIIDIAALRRQARRASPLARVPRARPPKVLCRTTSDDLKAAFFSLEPLGGIVYQALVRRLIPSCVVFGVGTH